MERVHSIEMPIFDDTELPSFLPDLKRRSTEILCSRVCKLCGQIIHQEHLCRFSALTFDKGTGKMRCSNHVRLKGKELEYLIPVLRQFIKELIDVHVTDSQEVQTPLCIYDSIMNETQTFHSSLLSLLLFQL